MLLGSARNGSTALSYQNSVITPGWRLMRTGYHMCFHRLYDKKIWPIDSTLSGVTTPGQSTAWSNGNKRGLHFSQSSNITGAVPSDYLLSYPGHLLGESYLSAWVQSVYSTAVDDRATNDWCLIELLVISGSLNKFSDFFHWCVSSHSDCIFEIHQLWQTGFSRVYSNCCCSCWFEAEIIKIGQSSHKMYSNNILNFQESMTILNACTKKSGNLLNAPRT